MQTVYLIGGMALVTFGIRYILLLFSGKVVFSPSLKRALGYVPPAVLTAIIVPAVLLPDGHHVRLTFTNPYLAGALFTILIHCLTRNMLVTILGGMVAFALWQWGLTLI